MIYSYNTIGFYSDKNNRQYENTENEKIIHVFETDTIPNFQIIVDGSITSNVTYKLYDINDNEIKSGTCTKEAATTENDTAYTRIKLSGATTTGEDEGRYYIELTYDSSTIYSDVFCWKDDVSDLLKISVVFGNDLMIGGRELNVNADTYTVYLETKNHTEDYEISEEGVEKSYGNLILHSSRNHIVEYIITGYRKTLDFLAGLRVVSHNGTVKVTLAGEEYEIYDIENPEKSDTYSNSDLIIISFRFKINDYLQTINEINSAV
ncbi:MAG: hypothetical protein ACOCUV_00905 [bacterium]